MTVRVRFLLGLTVALALGFELLTLVVIRAGIVEGGVVNVRNTVDIPTQRAGVS